MKTKLIPLTLSCLALSARAIEIDESELTFPRPDVNVAEFSRGVKFTVSGYAGTQELTNFPVLVKLSAGSPTGFSYADFYNPGDVPGGDLCFLDADGNGIPHEIDTWNTSGQSLVWVTLPRMTNGTEFAMWYRSSKSGALVNGDNAWKDYTGVWHLSNAGDGVQSEPDSTTNALTATTHANSLAVANGPVGAARRVSTVAGASQTNGRIFVDLTDPAKRAVVDALTPSTGDVVFTASFWLCMRGNTQWAYLVDRKEDDKYPAWGLQFDQQANKTPMRIYSAGNSDNANIKQAVATYNNGVWKKIDIVWNNSQYILYFDGGANKYTGALYNSAKAVSGSMDLAFGGCAGSGYGSLIGEMDELRLRAGNMGDDWVRADYDTVTSASFLAAGEVVSLAETPKPVATLSLLDSSAKYAQFAGAIGSCGGAATACSVYVKIWKTALVEPDAWTLLAGGLEEGDSFTEEVTGLDPETPYSFKLKATNNLDPTAYDSDIVAGSFTTGGTGAGGTGGDRMRVGNDYVHVFEIDPETGDDTFEFTPPSYVSSIQALVVAGGGPGGYRRGGGGGAGGLIHDTALAVSGGSTYTIHVGSGGVASTTDAAYGSNGGTSSISLGATTNALAIGGGAGGNYNASFYAGVAGGSGGGSQRAGAAVGAGTPGQGHDGAIGTSNNGNKAQAGDAAGGGGGAGQVGSAAASDDPPSGGTGGAGYLCDITGTAKFYAGGGGGGGVQKGKNANNHGGPGGGGEGGGGRGGMDRSAEGESTTAAVAGTPGTGGGGGGGSDVAGSYEGANGGSGIVVVRYTVQGAGAGSAEPVVSLTGARYGGDLAISGTYRVAWAGEGAEDADVYIRWGYSARSLTHSVRVAQDAIGTGSFTISVPVDQTTVFLRAVAVNGDHEGLSDEIVPIYIPEYDGVVPGDTTIPVLGAVALAEVDGAFARIGGTVTSFGTAGEGEDPIDGCVVYALVGTSDNVSRMTAHAELAVTAGEAFSYPIDGLAPGTTYHWCLEARNSAGVVVATQVGSFTTIERSVANAVASGVTQRTHTVNGSLSEAGAGTTTVLARWQEGGVWSEWAPIATFTKDSASKTFSASRTTEAWSGTVNWEVCVSNECVTSAGEPTGVFWTSTQSGSSGASADNATYTWRAVDGEWDGSWDDPAHWACNQADNRGYPQASTATVAFNNNTVATIQVPGDYTFKEWSVGKSGVDITFVGQGAETSALRGNIFGGDGVTRCRWTFSALRLAESNGIDFGGASSVDATLAFADGAVASTGSGTVNLAGSNVWMVVEGGASFERAVRNGTKDGGLRLDDGTVAGANFRTDCNGEATTNEWFVFSGAAPRLTATGSFRNDSDATANLQNADTFFVFSVPAAGWAAAPLYAEYSSTEKFGGMLGAGEGGYVLSVDPESPALNAPGNRAVQLAEWRSGIDTAHVRLAEPPAGVTLSWTYGWPSELDAPANEGDAPTGVRATLSGSGPRTFLLMW